MTATLLLIRHAMHTDYGERFTGRADGVPLSAKGEQQARRLAARLTPEPIAAIYSSPRERTLRTAEAVAAPHGLIVRTADALDEVDLGDWTGKRIANLEGTPDFVRWNEERDTATPPGGEAMPAVADRAETFASEIAARHEGKTVLLVSHADVIRALVCRVLGLPFANFWRFEIGPASVSRLLFGAWGGKLLSLNEGAAA
jgi:broad specificity phosphatase PhoE